MLRVVPMMVVGISEGGLGGGGVLFTCRCELRELFFVVCFAVELFFNQNELVSCSKYFSANCTRETIEMVDLI